MSDKIPVPIGGATDCAELVVQRGLIKTGSQASEQDGKGGKGCSRGMVKLEVVGCNRI